MVRKISVIEQMLIEMRRNPEIDKIIDEKR